MPIPFRSYRAAIVLSAFSLGATAVSAQPTVKFAPSSKIVIEGTSNVHDWACATSTFDADIKLPEGPAAEIGKSVTSLVVTIPVKSIDCGHGDMNKNLQKAMNAGQFPTVRYRMTSYTATPQAGSYDVVVQGVMTINGTDKPVELRATVTPQAGGAAVVGSTSLNTTDFGVKRVSVMLGTMKTGAKVTITFRLTPTQT